MTALPGFRMFLLSVGSLAVTAIAQGAPFQLVAGPAAYGISVRKLVGGLGDLDKGTVTGSRTANTITGLASFTGSGGTLQLGFAFTLTSIVSHTYFYTGPWWVAGGTQGYLGSAGGGDGVFSVVPASRSVLGVYSYEFDGSMNPVPEPATFAGLGIASVILLRPRKPTKG